jgi:hypothetical protein
MAISRDDIVERNFRIANNNAIDMHVGKRVRLRRTLLGMSQEQLGVELNVTFQQVQKYERGASAHHGYGISVKFVMCRSAIFFMICRKVQCAALRAGSALAIMQMC